MLKGFRSNDTLVATNTLSLVSWMMVFIKRNQGSLEKWLILEA